MKIFMKFTFAVFFVFFFLGNYKYNQNESNAFKLATLDGNTSESYVSKTQYLLNSLSGKYQISETEICDKILYLCQNLLIEKYRVNHKIQFAMECISRIQISNAVKDDFAKAIEVYGIMINSGQTSNDIIDRLNNALQFDRNALDLFIKQ